MKKLLTALSLTLALGVAAACGASDSTGEVAEWEAQAERVTIIRDDWGIPHIYGTTDADAVFGMIYAQAEDDFNRIEVNFLNSQGRLAEAEGESEIWRDLRMKLFIDPAEMQAMYAEAPEWLQALMDSWADGLNYYLHTHPEVTPRVITRFEPWMALTFSEGSIGGDIERVSLQRLQDFYGSQDQRNASLDTKAGEDRTTPTATSVPAAVVATLPKAAPKASPKAAPKDAFMPALESGLVVPDPDEEPTGSNGFAIAPTNSATGNALLLINPHTSFFFREELHMVSEEGLNAYGAVTWGQFFVYQGFNEDAGWMHTSSGVDNIDEYAETIVERDGSMFYVYGAEERPLVTKEIRVPFRTDAGMDERVFTVYETHHGPIVREADGRWISVALMEEPLKALQQSYLRTKARNYDEFYESMEYHTNSSNNTVFADSEGNIAYFHSNFVPIRDLGYDWARPVDGSDPGTDWQGVHPIDDSPNMVNPANGWIQNTNNWPYTVSGEFSPDIDDFPGYMQRSGENARGVHAIRVLDGVSNFTLQTLIDAAYDSYLTGFEDLVPAVVSAWEQAPQSHPLKSLLAEPIGELEGWDLRYTVESVPTSVAIFWGEELRRIGGTNASQLNAEAGLQALAAAIAKLEEDFGSWRTPWGEINRFQRLTGDIVQPFSDDGPSTPVEFASSRWGSLASFGARAYPGTKRWYGTSGNSFVAVVEFGDRVSARAVTAGGLNSDPDSPHFNDQTERYATGDLREVYYYRDQLDGHIEREYRPGS